MFLSDLVVVSLRDKRWKLKSDFIYQMWDGNQIKVPAGFITDLASVPQLFWSIFPKDGRYREAAVIHDFLYFTLGMDGAYTRKQSDQIFLEAMQDLNISWWRRVIIHRAVRIGGRYPQR